METISTDVLVIGAGAAGIRAAAAARENGAEVILAAADDAANGGSSFSKISRGWGIQALVGKERTPDNLETFYNDIIRVGLDQSDPRLVGILVEESGAAVEDLMSYGLEFKKDADGNHIRTRGCFSEFERAFITKDFENIRQTFLSILRRFAVNVVTGYASDLISEGGTCRGAYLVLKSGEYLQIEAKATILATGGGSGIFYDNMGNGGGTGDGYALAHLAGADLINMEFIQFALGMKKNGDCHFLPIGQLDQTCKVINSSGSDILKNYLPEDSQRNESLEARKKHMPFSCRDLSGLVDIGIAEARRSDKAVYWQNGNPANGQLEITHFAHAFNGGVKINENGESSVPGLYAAGEVAAGPHGADRIGGCMMTATQVFGKRAGQTAAQRAKRISDGFSQVIGKERKSLDDHVKSDDDDLQAFAVIERRIKAAMGEYAGVLRSKKGLKKCRKILKTCANQLRALELIGLANNGQYFKVRNLIITANLVAESAFARKESKGPHYREDG